MATGDGLSVTEVCSDLGAESRSDMANAAITAVLKKWAGRSIGRLHRVVSRYISIWRARSRLKIKPYKSIAYDAVDCIVHAKCKMLKLCPCKMQ